MTPKEYELLLSDVEVRLDRLRALYDQWFQGMERLEPQVARKDVERKLQVLRKEKPRNTGLRFRFQTVQQKWSTYLAYWTRVARQIEEGTFRRDVLRARAKREQARSAFSGAGSAPKQAEASTTDAAEVAAIKSAAAASLTPPAGMPPTSQPAPARPSLTPFASPSARLSVPPPPPPRPMVQAPATAEGPQYAQIYQQYIETRRKNNESTEVQFDVIERSLRTAEKQLREKHAGKKIDFEVVIKDGKTAFKPVAKK